VEGEDNPVVAAVTNGMSDYRMRDLERPGVLPRRELIQYFHVCTEEFARRLHEASWLPHFDGFSIDVYDSISWPDALAGEFRHSFFLCPPWRSHKNFRVAIDLDEVSFLWHIPITDEELEYKKTRGVNALLDRMEKVDLPWVFDPSNRPSLLKRRKRKR